jgi:probable rRNA maturation factor
MAAFVRVQQGGRLRHRRRPAGEPPVSAVHPAVRAAVRATLRHEGVADAEVSVTLMADDEIAELNVRYLQHEGPTDVISFALYEDGEDPVGDVYIGFEQALRQAAALGVAPTHEIARLAVHGTLHVLGHDHPPGEERLDSEMWRVQEAIVAALPGHAAHRVTD